MMAYLHKNDIDYYHYMVTEPEEEKSLVLSDLSLDGSLAWLSENAVDGRAYTVILSGDETITPKTLSYSGKTVRVTLSGGMAERTVSLGSTGSLFTVESGVTLTLDNNVTLQGRKDNRTSLISVSGGALVMNAGSKISGNTNSSYGGGTFTSVSRSALDRDTDQP